MKLLPMSRLSRHLSPLMPALRVGCGALYLLLCALAWADIDPGHTLAAAVLSMLVLLIAEAAVMS